jgi:HEAT repeat protein
MKMVDDFLARRRVQKLRVARSLPAPELAKLVDELVAMGPCAVEPLSECLSHGEARGPALEALERLAGDDTFDHFLALLSSPNPTIVSGASRVLSASKRFDPRRLVAALAAETPPRSVLEPILLVHATSIPMAEAVAAFPGLSREGQLVLLRAIEKSQNPKAATYLLNLVHHEDPWIRASIVKLLAERPGPGLVEGLTPLLKDENKNVRLEVVLALHALKAKGAVPALLGALEDPDLKVQSAAIDALREVADVTAVPALVAVLTSESEYARRGAVEVLNEVATAEAIQDLVRALRDQDWWVRVRAADALGTLGGDKVVQAVIGLMQDKDEFTRRHAIEILNVVPDPSAVPTLVAALDDPDWWVRERAIDALGKNRDARSVEPLLALLAREEGTAAMCVRALGAIGHPAALRPLVALLDSPAADVRREVQEALLEFPRGELSSADRDYLKDVLDRAQAETSHSTEIPMRVRSSGDRGSSLLGGLPLTGPAGGMPPAPPARPAPPPPPAPPAIRRETTGALGLNFAELAEGQDLIERFRIVRKIGRGGFGTVYLARDLAIGEDIILKILNPQLSMDETATRRFVQELKLTRRVAHRNVIRIFDFLDLGGARAISMEYFPGSDLGRLMAEEGRLDVRRGLKIAAQVADGLAAAHAEGVAHRDIKPANILVGANDDTRLVDFGLASVHGLAGEGSRLTKSGLLIGTPEYMAPEQISDESVDHRADLYSLGIVMYEMFAGRKPFTAETPVKILFQHLEGGAEPLSSLVPGIPPEVETLVALTMARDPNARPQTALELRAALVHVLESLEVSR